MALLGIGMAGIWAPLAATATRNLPMQHGRCRVGRLQRHAPGRRRARLGRDRVLLDSRIAAHGLSGGAEPDGALQQLPTVVRAPFSAAMSDTLLLPVGVLLLGLRLGAVLRAAAPPGGAARSRHSRPQAQAPAPAAVLD